MFENSVSKIIQQLRGLERHIRWLYLYNISNLERNYLEL